MPVFTGQIGPGVWISQASAAGSSHTTARGQSRDSFLEGSHGVGVMNLGSGCALGPVVLDVGPLLPVFPAEGLGTPPSRGRGPGPAVEHGSRDALVPEGWAAPGRTPSTASRDRVGSMAERSRLQKVSRWPTSWYTAHAGRHTARTGRGAWKEAHCCPGTGLLGGDVTSHMWGLLKGGVAQLSCPIWVLSYLQKRRLG